MATADLKFESTPELPFVEGAWFENSAKIKLFVGRVPPAAGVKPHCTVVFVHGIDDHGPRWKHVCEGLAANPHLQADCYMPEWQGHGRSQGFRNTPGLIASIDSVLEDLERVIQFAARAHPGVPLFLFGHSAGGLFSVLMLTKRQRISALVSGVVLSAPALKPHAKDDTWVNFKVVLPLSVRLLNVWPTMPSPVPLGTELTHDEEFMAKDDDDDLTGNGVRTGTVVGIAYSMKALDEDKLFEKFTHPFLMLCAAEDKLVSPQGFKLFEERAQTAASDKKVIWFEKAWHEVLREVPQVRTKAQNAVEEWMKDRIAQHRPHSRM
mmetsp:Transcript_54489/g.129904  ORF Transcript_54489/g.129904 Transcript_54489/m.129904 type:complete len:322 (+) Transcript_54489:42-1007(+)